MLPVCKGRLPLGFLGRGAGRGFWPEDGQNSHSIGVCYCGGCPPRSVKNWANQGKDTRTPEQRAAIIRLCKELKSRYPSATLHGHNEFANKACPSFIVKNDPDLCAL